MDFESFTTELTKLTTLYFRYIYHMFIYPVDSSVILTRHELLPMHNLFVVWIELALNHEGPFAHDVLFIGLLIQYIGYIS